MRDLTDEILELVRRTSSSLPKDVEERLRASIEKEEPGSATRGFVPGTDCAKSTGSYKLEQFGVSEAMGVIQVNNFLVVTMDAHGESQHKVIDEQSQKVLDNLLKLP